MSEGQQPHIDPDTGDETHPAFGTAVVSRSSGSGRALFQSDLLHNETIRLSVCTAVRHRELNQDWVHPHEEIVEIEMSLAQWGALVSSIGLGSGVPVTIRRCRETDESGTSVTTVPSPPYQPRMAENQSEVAQVVDRLFARVSDAATELRAVIEEKRGIRATRRALSKLEAALAGAGPNSRFAVDTLAETAEQVVSQARADIEAHLLQVAQRLSNPEQSQRLGTETGYVDAHPSIALPTIKTET